MEVSTPIFEFECAECGESFEELVHSASAVGEVECPAWQSPQFKKKISLFAARAGGRDSFPAVSTTSSCSTSSG